MLNKTIKYLAILCFFISIKAKQPESTTYGMQSDNLFFDITQNEKALRLLQAIDPAVYQPLLPAANDKFYNTNPFDNAYRAIDTLFDINSNGFIKNHILSEKQVPKGWISYPLVAFILSKLNFEITDDMKRIDIHADLIPQNLDIHMILKQKIDAYETYNTLIKMQLMMLSFIIIKSTAKEILNKHFEKKSKRLNLGNIIDIIIIQLLIFSQAKLLKEKISILNNTNNLRDRMNLNNPLYYINFKLYNWNQLMNKLIYRLIDLGLILYEL